MAHTQCASEWDAAAGGAPDDRGIGIAAAPNGDVLVSGWFGGTADFGGGPLVSAGDADAFLARYDADGNHVWSLRVGGSQLDQVKTVAVGSSGDVYAVGLFSDSVTFGSGGFTSFGLRDAYVSKRNSSGGHVWTRQMGGTGSDIGWDCAVDSNLAVIVTGHFSDTVDFGGGGLASNGGFDVFLAKYNSSGGHVWSRSFGGTDIDRGHAVTVDPDGKVYLTGRFRGSIDFGGGPLASSGGYDIFVAKFDANGNHIFSNAYGGTGHDEGRGITVGPGGDVWITGWFENAVDFGGGAITANGQWDVFVARYDSAGAYVSDKTFGGSGFDIGQSVKVRPGGGFVVAGSYESSVDFGLGPESSNGLNDAFVAEFDSAGNPVCAWTWGAGGDDESRNCAIDASGDVLVAGRFAGIVDFGSGNVAANGGTDAFWLKLGVVATGITPQGLPPRAPLSLTASPNPFNPRLDIRFTIDAPGPVSIRVIDVKGHEVATLARGARHEAGAHSLAWHGTDSRGRALPSGAYFVAIEQAGATATRKVLLVK